MAKNKIQFRQFYESWTQQSVTSSPAPGVRSLTPIPSSFSFTVSSKLSAGGYGHFADFKYTGLRGGDIGTVGVHQFQNASDDTDTRAFLEMRKESTILSSTPITKIPASIIRGGTEWGSANSTWDSSDFQWDITGWDEIPYTFQLSRSPDAGNEFTITDDFNRADGGLGSNWNTIAGTWAIASNKAQQSGSGVSVTLWNTVPSFFHDTQYVQANFTKNTDNSFASHTALVLKYRNSGGTITMHYAYVANVAGTDEIGIVRWSGSSLTSGAQATLIFTGVEITNGDLLRFEYRYGHMYFLRWNGSSWDQMTYAFDPTLRGNVGVGGLRTNNGTGPPSFDNFEYGSLPDTQLSVGGFGHFNDLYRKAVVKISDTSRNVYQTSTMQVSAGGDVKNGSAHIECTIQVGAGVLINGAATMNATGNLSAILTKEETGVPAALPLNGTLTCISNPITVEAGMYGGIITNNRLIEAPESIAGSMTAEGVTAQFSDLYSGYYDRRLMWGFQNYPALNFNQKRLTSSVGNEWLKVPLFTYNEPEEDVTPEDSDIDGIVTGWTSDFFSGSISERFGTIDNLTYTRFTQISTEVLAQVSSNARFTQMAHEVLISPGSRARMSQTAVEVLRQINVGWIQQEAVEAIGNQITALRYALIQQCALEVMYSIKAKVNLTQVATEVLKGTNPNPPVNLTSVAGEVLRQRTELDGTPSFIQQMALECLRNNPSPAIINHMALEWVIQPIPPAVINHAALEWVRNATLIPAVVNHAALELIRDAAITPARFNHIAIELLVRPEFDPTVSSLINNPKVYY